MREAAFNKPYSTFRHAALLGGLPPSDGTRRSCDSCKRVQHLEAKARKEGTHLGLLEESNEEGPVQRVVIVHACVGCCGVEVGVPRHLQSCRHHKPNMHIT